MRLIDADALINRIVFHTDLSTDAKEAFEDEVNAEPTVEPERKTGKWIPFTSHVPDEEEKELYSDYEYILDGPLPESGQMILVTVTCAGHERVQADEFYSDDGCYLESGYDLVTEAVAWMPLPEPYVPDINDGKKED